jgi:hypothetical protein
MKAAHIIDELKTFHAEGVEYRSLERHLTESDVERWRNACGWSRSQFFDEIAKGLALGYNASELSFDFCDMVVNDLAGPVANTSGPKPQIFGMSIRPSISASTITATIEMKTLLRFIPAR